MTIANQILAQLGGNKFLAMTGAIALADESGKSLTLKLPKILKASAIEIVLDESTDTYTVQEYTGRGLKMGKRGEPIQCIHSSQVRDVFTELTGLAVSL